MLKRITVLIIIGLSLFSCAKKSTEWNEKHIMNLIVTIPLMGNPMDLDIAGQHVYIAEDQGGLSIVNISNYTKKWMNRIVSIDGDTLDLVKTRRLSVDLSMNRLFINETEGSDEIRVIDITNLDSLKIIDRISGGTQDINYMKFNKITDVNNVYFYEGIFCSGRNVNYGRHGFHITGIPPFFAVDLPIETSATGRGAFLGNQYIYAAIEQRGLAIYNRTNGALISEIDLPGEAQKVVVSGNYAYLACRQDGLQIVDVSNPAVPVKVGSYDTSGYATNLDISNNLVALSSGGGGIYLFDVSNPAKPVLKDNITSCGYVNNVKFYQNKIYVAARDKGLLVYNIVP